MKTKNLKGLILDQEEASCEAFSKIVKDLFAHFYKQNNPESAFHEWKDIKAHIIFINLNIKQRNSNLSLLEKITPLKDNSTLFFGYMDAHDPELVAHAIELGFQDIFTRPFDTDMIASKINRFIISNTTIDRDLSYTRMNRPLPAKIQLSFSISSIDENGIHLKSDHYISKGTVFHFDAPIIKEIFEKDSIEFMITRTSVGDHWGEHFAYAEPRTPNEQYNASLRRFILGKT